MPAEKANARRVSIRMAPLASTSAVSSAALSAPEWVALTIPFESRTTVRGSAIPPKTVKMDPLGSRALR